MTSDVNSRRQDDGHCVVQHALSKQQRVQVAVRMQLVEDGQHRHCTAENQCKHQRLILHLQAPTCVNKCRAKSHRGLWPRWWRRRRGSRCSRTCCPAVRPPASVWPRRTSDSWERVGGGAAGEQVSNNFCEHEATLEKQEAGWTLTQWRNRKGRCQGRRRWGWSQGSWRSVSTGEADKHSSG